MLRSYFLSSFVEFCSVVSEEKSKMSQLIRGQGGHLVFLIGPKNTNLVEGIEILLPVKFRLCFQSRSQNVSFNQRPGRPSCFSYWPENTNLVEDVEIVLPIKFRLRFQRRSRKMSQSIRGHGSHLVFLISQKNTNLVEDVEILLPVKFRWIAFSSFRGEVQNVKS